MNREQLAFKFKGLLRMEIQEVVDLSEKYLIENEQEWSDSWNGYADKIQRKTEILIESRDNFKEWKPLNIHMSVNDIVNKRDNQFSLRCLGFEVASILIDKDKVPQLTISRDNEKSNRTKFSMPLKANQYEWRSKEATEFRKHFKLHEKKYRAECALESLILDEMEKNTRDKFMGTMRNFQPIKLMEKFRFQMPVPLSAYSGLPKYQKGNIDILARIGIGSSTNISVLELKKNHRSSNTYKSALTQSIIYSLCIRRLLRSKSGMKWFNLFGYKRKLPENLNLYSVAMIPHRLKDFYEKEIEELRLKEIDHCINIDSDRIKCGYIFFEHVNGENNTDRIQIIDTSDFINPSN